MLKSLKEQKPEAENCGISSQCLRVFNQKARRPSRREEYQYPLVKQTSTVPSSSDLEIFSEHSLMCQRALVTYNSARENIMSMDILLEMVMIRICHEENHQPKLDKQNQSVKIGFRRNYQSILHQHGFSPTIMIKRQKR